MSNHFQFSALLPRAATRRRLVSTLALGALMLLLAIQPALASSARPAIAQSVPAAATVAVAANADFGDILVDANGMTLYMFDKDVPGTSNCYGGCAERWPPLLIAAGETPVAGEGVTAELGTTERTDGTVQVTANGWPLYYWFEDTAAGETKGQAVGDVWWVMGPDGTINRTAPAPAEEAAAPAEAPAPAPATVAMVSNADYGDILVDANGMTLYMFDKDAPGTSNCYDKCAERWPPLLIAAGETPVAGDGVTAELGTTERTDGTVQVTANGWPLYYWFEDEAAGDTKGQAVGDVWWVMGPDGTINRTAPAPAEEAAAPVEAPAPATVAVAANADFGDILVDANGMTLYMFDKDAPGTSNCYDKCAERWPPLLIAAGETPVAGDGVTAELGTTERTDGTVQVTANGWPLYYWFEDEAAGDTKGQAVGDVWWVMGPDGTINRTAPAPAEEAAAPAEAPAQAEAPAATEGPAPTQMPVTGAGGDLLPLAMAGMTLLAGGGWVALRRNKRA